MVGLDGSEGGRGEVPPQEDLDGITPEELPRRGIGAAAPSPSGGGGGVGVSYRPDIPGAAVVVVVVVVATPPAAAAAAAAGPGAAAGDVQERPQCVGRGRLHDGQRLGGSAQELPEKRRVVLADVGEVDVDVATIGIPVGAAAPAPALGGGPRRVGAAGSVGGEGGVGAAAVGGVMAAVHPQKSIAVDVPTGPLAVVPCVISRR